MNATVEPLTEPSMGDVTKSPPSLSISPTDLAPQTTTWILHNATCKCVSHISEQTWSNLFTLSQTL